MPYGEQLTLHVRGAVKGAQEGSFLHLYTGGQRCRGELGANRFVSFSPKLASECAKARAASALPLLMLLRKAFCRQRSSRMQRAHHHAQATARTTIEDGEENSIKRSAHSEDRKTHIWHFVWMLIRLMMAQQEQEYSPIFRKTWGLEPISYASLLL